MTPSSYLLYGLTLLISTHHIHTSNAQPDIAMIQFAWDAIVALHDRYVADGKHAPVPVLVFYDPILKFNHMHPVIWNEEIDSEKMSITPLQELYRAVPDVIYSYSKKREIDPAKCELFYKFGSNGDRITINSDEIIIDMLTLEPDFEGRRRIFVKCPDIVLQCDEAQCDADTHEVDEYNENSNNKQYHLAMNAYRHVKGHQIQMNEDKIEKYEEELEDMELAGFSVTSEATQKVHQSIDAYVGQLEERAEAFGWDSKMIMSAKDASSAKATTFAEKEVVFDQENWKLKGKYRRLATFLSDDGKKISYVVSTSKFESDIPVKDREQGFIAKYITNKGTVKNSFRKRILYLMQADGIQASNDNLMLPKEYEYMSIN